MTSAWNDARAKLSAFFRKHKDHDQLLRELDATYARLKVGPSKRDSEIARWAVILTAVAEENPDAAIGVSMIALQLAQYAGAAADARIRQTGFAARDQYNIGGSLTIQRSRVNIRVHER